MPSLTCRDNRIPGPNDLYELIDGGYLILPTNAYQGYLAGELFRGLHKFADRAELGAVYLEMLYSLIPCRCVQRRPDVSFVSYHAWPKRRRLPSSDAWEVVPAFAADVVSADDLAENVIAKVRDYFRAGVRLVWVIYAEAQQVYIYTSPRVIRVAELGDTLDGGDVLPGFTLPLAQFFGDDTE